MSNTASSIEIPTRLEEPGRILFFETDEFIVLVAPIVFGMMTRNMIPAVILGVVGYMLWTRIKGTVGYYGLHAWRYWYLPAAMTRLKGLPDSAVERWSA